MDYELKKLLKEVLITNAFVNRNSNDEPTFDPIAINVPCRIQRKMVMIPSADGKDVISSCQIFTDGAAVIFTDTKITLPDGTTPKILNVYSSPDEFGSPYYKCVYT